MLARPEVKLAQELFILGQNADARRQWAWATRNMNNHELKVAAVIASRWGWHDRAILTVSKTDHLNDLDLRFPILYRDIVEESARENNIDSGWVYGVLRQESAFVIDARSDAGALGLMQLMPMTGRVTGRGIKLHIKNNSALIKVENNLRLGTRYLKIVLDGNDGSQVLATAAYNAGPNRVKEWLPETGALDADIWVENISFAETRNYVKNVLAFTIIYDYRLGNNLLRLQQRMPAVTPAKVTVGSYP
jgi:soluble lytic murein transglycosylase